MTYRIDRTATETATVFVLSGDMNADQVSQLRALVALEATARVVLDLKEVTLVDRDSVIFLAHIEVAGVTLRNCPPYVRTWIAGERGKE